MQAGGPRCKEALSPFGREVVAVGLERSTESQVVGVEGEGEIKGH